MQIVKVRRFVANVCFICCFLLCSASGRTFLGESVLLKVNSWEEAYSVSRRVSSINIRSPEQTCPGVNGKSCSKNGYCEHGRCKCFPGYAGKACNFKIDESQKFDIDCAQLNDQYTSFAIHETTIGACPQYRLVWSLLAQKTCKAMTGQPCDMNQRREFCMGLADCPDLCQTYFDITCAKLTIDDSLQRTGRNITSGPVSPNQTVVNLGNNLPENSLLFKGGSYSGLKTGKIKKQGWLRHSNTLLKIRVGGQTILAKGGMSSPISRI